MRGFPSVLGWWTKRGTGRKTGALLAQRQHRVLRDKRRQISTAYSISVLHLAQCSLFLVMNHIIWCSICTASILFGKGKGSINNCINWVKKKKKLTLKHLAFQRINLQPVTLNWHQLARCASECALCTLHILTGPFPTQNLLHSPQELHESPRPPLSHTSSIISASF